MATHPGTRTGEDEPGAKAPADVDADNARTVVMAPVVGSRAVVPSTLGRQVAEEPDTLLVGAARPLVPVPPERARLLD